MFKSFKPLINLCTTHTISINFIHQFVCFGEFFQVYLNILYMLFLKMEKLHTLTFIEKAVTLTSVIRFKERAFERGLMYFFLMLYDLNINFGFF